MCLPARHRRYAVEAAQAYAFGRSCPPELVHLTGDNTGEVRAAAICALAASRHEEAHACTHRALSDDDLAVRLAAIEALGVLSSVESRDSLRKLAGDSSDVIRARGREVARSARRIRRGCSSGRG